MFEEYLMLMQILAGALLSLAFALVTPLRLWYETLKTLPSPWDFWVPRLVFGSAFAIITTGFAIYLCRNGTCPSLGEIVTVVWNVIVASQVTFLLFSDELRKKAVTRQRRPLHG